ncbi:MAG: hypothetical protein ABGY71_00280 [bacterium]|nr:hypothetical protein [Planctomycetota bacterium]HIL52823.1 hypothetical protein [Planctomycetota bacterium]
MKSLLFTAPALCALAPAALACPSCSVGQGMETLLFVMGFLGVPYLVVTGVLFWMRQLTAGERIDP